MHFYFNIRRNGQTIVDSEGSSHSDLTAARIEARAAAREILANAIRERRDVSSDAILITDAAGQELAAVSIASFLPDPLWQKISLLD